jgi:hypothetical protein
LARSRSEVVGFICDFRLKLDVQITMRVLT